NPNKALVRETAPASEPLTLAEAKLYLRVDGSAEDSLITDMITAVREAAEEYLRKSLITQSWVLTYEDYAPAVAMLPRGPVQSISSVKVIDRSGAETAVSNTVYHLGVGKASVHFDTVQLGYLVEIIYSTGYGDADAVPEAIRQGMLTHLAALYDNRIDGMSLPAASIALYKPYREVRIG
ncbi:MAG: head-tail connector protein, partial [Rickettsiales bacterium]